MMASLVDFIVDLLGDAMEHTDPHLNTPEELAQAATALEDILVKAERALEDITQFADPQLQDMDAEGATPPQDSSPSHKKHKSSPPRPCNLEPTLAQHDHS